MPGLVNAHTHVPMTLLRGLADDLRLDVWLMGYMLPVEREFVEPCFVGLGTPPWLRRDIRSGITCFADMSYFFEEAVAEATAAAGMRALCAQTVLRFPAPDATSYEDSLARARDFITAVARASADRPGAAPHGPGHRRAAGAVRRESRRHAQRRLRRPRRRRRSMMTAGSIGRRAGPLVEAAITS